jgi:hypothetical protein
MLEKIGKGKRSEFIKHAIIQAGSGATQSPETDPLKLLLRQCMQFFQKNKAALQPTITPEERAVFKKIVEVL